MKVLGMGDNVCDVYLHQETMYPGGQAVNFAVYASKLGMPSAYMGVFGNDGVASAVKKALDKYQVDYSLSRTYEGENGFARVTLVDGDRVFKGSNKGGVLRAYPIHFEEGDLEKINAFSLIHTTCNGFTDDLLPQLKQAAGFVSYDFSYRWNEEDRVDRTCPYIDFAFLSCSDLNDEETEALCRKLHEKGCRVITATRGSKGATVYDGTKFYRQLPHLVVPVDTMGAGDSFATAMLVSLLEELKDAGKNDPDIGEKIALYMEQALDKAAEFSAGNCLVSGAFGEGQPVPENMRDRIYNGQF